MSIVESTMTKCQTFFQSLNEAEQADSLLQLSLEPSWEKRGRGQLRGRTWSLTWTLAPGGTSLGYFTAHGIQGLRKVWKSGGGGGGSKSYVVGIICPPAQVEIIGSNDLPKTGWREWPPAPQFRRVPWVYVCTMYSDKACGRYQNLSGQVLHM